MTQPLTDAIEALTTYANTVTGASDTTLSEAVATLASGYGGDEKLIEFIGSMKTLGADALTGVVLLEKTNFKAVTSVGASALKNAIGGKIIVFPSLTTISNYCFGTNADVETYDFGASTPNFTAWLFSGDSALKTIIIRKSTVVTAANVNVFNATCFASNGNASGGVLYVPQALVSSYQSASNWSTILGYAKNQILPIEGSYYETHYADGTLIQ